jgi:hypothetical protein
METETNGMNKFLVDRSLEGMATFRYLRKMQEENKS